MSRIGPIHAGLFAVGALVLTSACKADRDTGAVTSKTGEQISTVPSTKTEAKRDLALVRVVNALPGGTPISITAGDSAAFGAVKYKTATPYREIADNMFNFKLRAGTADTSTKPLAENRENLNEGGHYTIVAMPDQGGSDKANLRVLDDELKPIASEHARVRFINAVPAGKDVDVILKGLAQPLFDGVNFKSEAGWKEVEPASGTLEIRPDGKEIVLAKLADVKLEGGKSYTFVLAGRSGKYDVIRVTDEVAQAPQ
jgi:hypothetical protein